MMTFEHTLINLRRELIRTFAAMDEWFDRAQTLCCYKSSSEEWSINEVLEHVMLTNHFLLIIIGQGRQKALRKSETIVAADIIPQHYSLSSPALLEIAQPKAFVWQRPEHHQPTGRRALHEIRHEIRDQLDECLITLELLPHGEGILHHTTMSVNNLGKLDVYQYVYFLSLHGQRHLQQMKNLEEMYTSCGV